MAESSLVAQAERFASDLTSLLQRTLPDAPAATAEAIQDRVVVRPENDVALFVRRQRLATLAVHLRCRLDAHGTWLAVETSRFELKAVVDRAPVLRYDYVRDANRAPAAHLQVHAHRGALTHLLSQAGHERPHDLSSLHLPLGGARFRPCLEDVIQFLVEECRFDARPGWAAAVRDGRAAWRTKQARAVVRDFQPEAVETLRALGYRVEPPTDAAGTSDTALSAW